MSNPFTMARVAKALRGVANTIGMVATNRSRSVRLPDVYLHIFALVLSLLSAFFSSLSVVSYHT